MYILAKDPSIKTLYLSIVVSVFTGTISIDYTIIIILMHPYIFLLMEFQKPILYFQETVLNNFKSHLEKIKS